MNMIELNTIDPMIAARDEREYLMARIRALEQIIIDQSAFNLDVEFARFCRYARSGHLHEQVQRGWNTELDRFNHGNLQKRWLGWLACAKSREVTR